MDDLAHVGDAAQPHRIVWNLDTHHRIAGLRRSEEMTDGADAASTCSETRHLPHRPPLAELLETTEFRDVEPGVCHLSVVVELDGDLCVSLNASYWVDHDEIMHESASYPN